MRRFRYIVAAGTCGILALVLVPVLSQASGTTNEVTWGTPNRGARALVLYDDSPGDTFGWLGELNGIGDGNLASHFGLVTAEPVNDYTAGQMNSFSAVIYAGTTYNEPLPDAFVADVLQGTKPILWVGDNIWQLNDAGSTGADSSADTPSAFSTAYGWDPSTTYLDDNPTTGVTDNVAAVTYEGKTFTRNPVDGPIYSPHITNPKLVDVLAKAQCSDPTTTLPTPCSALTQVDGATSFPWAIRSKNILYVGESPLSNIDENDRYMIFSDLFFDVLQPNAPAVHDALIRLEDVNATMDPKELDEFTNFLSQQNIPFSVAVIPDYVDPNGFYTGGVPLNLPLTATPGFVGALKYMQTHGGTLIDHGYTHQYSNVANPYTAASEDFEFYTAQCSTTAPPNYTLDPLYATSTPATLAEGQSPCPTTDWVWNEGPVPNDSTPWAEARAEDGRQLFVNAGLGSPAIWTTPNYAASAADYVGIDSVFKIRYERELFFPGQLTGGPVNSSTASNEVLGQLFPYVVHDLYGETIIPEDLGDYEPDVENHHNARLADDLIAEANNMLAVRQGVAAIYFNPIYPLADLEQTVLGIKALGYTFVAPLSLVGNETSISNATKS